MGSWKSRPTCDSRQRGSRCRHRARGRGGGRESEMLARTPREPLALIVPVRPISPSVQQFWRASGVSRRRCGRAEAPRPPVAYTTRAPGDQRAHASCRAHGLPDLSPTITPGEPQYRGRTTTTTTTTATRNGRTATAEDHNSENKRTAAKRGTRRDRDGEAEKCDREDEVIEHAVRGAGVGSSLAGIDAAR